MSPLYFNICVGTKSLSSTSSLVIVDPSFGYHLFACSHDWLSPRMQTWIVWCVPSLLYDRSPDERVFCWLPPFHYVSISGCYILHCAPHFSFGWSGSSTIYIKNSTCTLFSQIRYLSSPSPPREALKYCKWAVKDSFASVSPTQNTSNSIRKIFTHIYSYIHCVSILFTSWFLAISPQRITLFGEWNMKDV